MAPHPSLHPRSRLTTSLFTTTLLLSFLVVGMPHILPCPRPRLEYSDTEDLSQRPHGQRKKSGSDRGLDAGLRKAQGVDDRMEDRICGEKGRLEVGRMELEREEMEARREVRERRRRGHECPVPKPGGWVGGLLGFREERKGDGEEVVSSEKRGRGVDGKGR